MSEPIPESIPTSADPRSRRPLKRARGGAASNTATAAQADVIETLFLDPDRPISLPQPSTKPTMAAPPEIVANVQGSSAGAGSGEFHVYKASRRREYERLRTMDEEAKKEEEDERWERVERERRERDEEKTRRNREKRNKKKGKKGVSPAVVGNENDAHMVADGEGKAGGGGDKKSVQVPRKDRNDNTNNDDGAAKGTNDMGVAAIVKENGIVIHDDD